MINLSDIICLETASSGRHDFTLRCCLDDSSGTRVGGSGNLMSVVEEAP